MTRDTSLRGIERAHQLRDVAFFLKEQPHESPTCRVRQIAKEHRQLASMFLGKLHISLDDTSA